MVSNVAEATRRSAGWKHQRRASAHRHLVHHHPGTSSRFGTKESFRNKTFHYHRTPPPTHTHTRAELGPVSCLTGCSQSLWSPGLSCLVVVLLWWIPGGWKVCLLLRRFSRDCRKERRARSSSRGEDPSSSTSAISAKVTGCVLKRASRERRERLRPRTTPLGTRSCCGNSSMLEARR